MAQYNPLEDPSSQTDFENIISPFLEPESFTVAAKVKAWMHNLSEIGVNILN